jgi:hypothetical protein
MRKTVLTGVATLVVTTFAAAQAELPGGPPTEMPPRPAIAPAAPADAPSRPGFLMRIDRLEPSTLQRQQERWMRRHRQSFPAEWPVEPTDTKPPVRGEKT